MKDVLKNKSYKFAIEIVTLYKHLYSDNKEYVLSKQLLRSGTAIGALVSETEFAQSKADFVHKLSIALKEANETNYWLELLKDSGYISNEQCDQFHPHCQEIIKMLVSSIKTLKGVRS